MSADTKWSTSRAALSAGSASRVWSASTNPAASGPIAAVRIERNVLTVSIRRSRFLRGDDFVEHRIKQSARPFMPLRDLALAILNADLKRLAVLVAESH